jgi:hypothetical protein
MPERRIDRFYALGAIRRDSWRHHERGRAARGIAGTVVNGACRNVSASLKQSYPLFTRGRSRAH